MSSFDPVRAKRDELTGLMDVARSIAGLIREAEERTAQVEQQLNACRKVNGFLRIAIDACRKELTTLESQQ